MILVSVFNQQRNIVFRLIFYLISLLNLGWMEQTAYYWSQHGCNVIAVNWKVLADPITLYPTIAAIHVPRVAKYLEKFIRILKASGALVSTISMVGHSLGAHIAGQAGYKLLTTNDRLNIIYGKKYIYLWTSH